MTDQLQELLEQALVSREAAEQALRDFQARVDNAQQLAHMGDYDWEIATDINRWSDQLFRSRPPPRRWPLRPLPRRARLT